MPNKNLPAKKWEPPTKNQILRNKKPLCFAMHFSDLQIPVIQLHRPGVHLRLSLSLAAVDRTWDWWLRWWHRSGKHLRYEWTRGKSGRASPRQGWPIFSDIFEHACEFTKKNQLDWSDIPIFWGDYIIYWVTFRNAGWGVKRHSFEGCDHQSDSVTKLRMNTKYSKFWGFRVELSWFSASKLRPVNHLESLNRSRMDKGCNDPGSS